MWHFNSQLLPTRKLKFFPNIDIHHPSSKYITEPATPTHSIKTFIMGSLASKQREDTKEGIKEVVEELPQNLKPAPTTKGSVTMAGYDPDKTPEENAEYHAEKKPISEKIHHVLKNKYPDGSVTMKCDPDKIKKDDSGADM
jgi:hypothetical protein